MKKLRIVFMGTPEFAVPSLHILVEAGKEIVGVITAPDKPQGRGKKLGHSAVKEYALEQGLPILQPTNLKNPEFLEDLRSLNADLQIVVAFRMLPRAVWEMPPIGTFNLHGSLLPQYRGAAPINWAIINGEEETGVTTFFLKHEIDTGDILLQEKEAISPDDTVGTVYIRLMQKGANLVLKTVEKIESGEYTEQPQPEVRELKKAPKIFKEDCEINWDQDASVVRNFIRGLSPYPSAWTRLDGLQLKVFETSVTSLKSNGKPGQMTSDGKKWIRVDTSDFKIEIKDLQLQGKKRMLVEDFLRGYRWNEIKENS
jgi:methionyl-tRNA formyltransferase